MQLVFWQGLSRLTEDLQSHRSLYQAGSVMIRLDRTDRTMMNLDIISHHAAAVIRSYKN
jgi:hypothetical protein